MEESKNNFTAFNVIGYIWKWRKPLIFVSAGVGIITYIICLFITPMYMATTLIYAPHQNFVSNEKFDVKQYGLDESTEQLMQILESRDLKSIIIEKYDLITHYKIDTTKRTWRSRIYKEYDGLVKAKRTEYGGILIKVKDKSPELAAQLANGIVAELDTLKIKIEMERATAVYNLVNEQIIELEKRMLRINDSIKNLADDGVFIYDYQVDRVVQQYAISLSQGNTSGTKRLQQELENLAKWGPVCVLLREDLIAVSRHISYLRTVLLNTKMNTSYTLPVKFVIETAIPIHKKVSPQRVVTSFFASVSAFFLTFFFFLIRDKIRLEMRNNKEE